MFLPPLPQGIETPTSLVQGMAIVIAALAGAVGVLFWQLQRARDKNEENQRLLLERVLTAVLTSNMTLESTKDSIKALSGMVESLRGMVETLADRRRTPR